MLRVTPVTVHYSQSPILLDEYLSASTEISFSSQPVVPPASILIFKFRKVCRARMRMERKYIVCEVDGLLHTLLNIKRLTAFFFNHESARSFTLPLTILLSPMTDTVSDAK